MNSTGSRKFRTALSLILPLLWFIAIVSMILKKNDVVLLIQDNYDNSFEDLKAHCVLENSTVINSVDTTYTKCAPLLLFSDNSKCSDNSTVSEHYSACRIGEDGMNQTVNAYNIAVAAMAMGAFGFSSRVAIEFCNAETARIHEDERTNGRRNVLELT